MTSENSSYLLAGLIFGFLGSLFAVALLMRSFIRSFHEEAWKVHDHRLRQCEDKEDWWKNGRKSEDDEEED